MKIKTGDVIRFMESWAKPSDALSWDNSGKQIYFDEEVDRVLLSLDLYDEVIGQAKKEQCKMIITHHPMFFSGIKQISQGSYMGDNIISLIDHRITVFSAHTSLDIAQEGVNDTLADFFHLSCREPLAKEEEKNMGIVGNLQQPMETEEFLEMVLQGLDVSKAHLYGQRREKISRIALLGGAGADFLPQAIEKGADVYFTSDFKHHDAQRAYEQGIMVMDVGHFHSEKIVLEKIAEKLQREFPQLDIVINRQNNFEIE